MAKIRLVIELDYDDSLMHSGDEDEDARNWFFGDILADGGRLSLSSGEIGDVIGSVKVVSVEAAAASAVSKGVVG